MDCAILEQHLTQVDQDLANEQQQSSLPAATSQPQLRRATRQGTITAAAIDPTKKEREEGEEGREQQQKENEHHLLHLHLPNQSQLQLQYSPLCLQIENNIMDCICNIAVIFQLIAE